MPTPNQSLIEALRGSDALSAVSVHGVRGQVVPDAIVVRPDEPWLEPATYCDYLQHYLAIVVVAAASGEDGVDKIYVVAQAIIDALPDTWEFVTVGSPIIDESTGTAFLAAPVRLNYKGEATV